MCVHRREGGAQTGSSRHTQQPPQPRASASRRLSQQTRVLTWGALTARQIESYAVHSITAASHCCRKQGPLHGSDQLPCVCAWPIHTRNSLCLLMLLLLLLLPGLLNLPSGHHPCVGQCADQCQPRQGGRLLHAHSQGEQGQGMTGRGHSCWSLSQRVYRKTSAQEGGSPSPREPSPFLQIMEVKPREPHRLVCCRPSAQKIAAPLTHTPLGLCLWRTPKGLVTWATRVQCC